MPGKSRKPKFNFQDLRFTQISESHCGPASLQMMLANLGIEVSQEAIAEAAGAAQLIELNGTRVDQLAQAVRQLAPEACFWWKDHASLDDLVELVAKRHYPVGVEWQGVFEDPDEDGDESEAGSETEEDDYGHYSVVTHVHARKRELIIADPYKDFISQARIFTFDEFEQRWYDFNEVPDPTGGPPRLVEDYHLLFVITPQNKTFPRELGLKRGEELRT